MRWGIIYACWMLFALFFTSQSYLFQISAGRPISWGNILGSWLLCAHCWALLTPLMLGLARRFPFQRRNWGRTLAIHLAAAVFFAAFSLLVYVLVYPLLLVKNGSQFSSLNLYRQLLVNDFHSGLIIYSVLLGIHHMLAYYRKYRERELAAAQLETRLARAQLDALKMQLHPHFLFNTLNTISVLMLEDVETANRMLVRLSDLLRITLEKESAHEVTLKEELEFLESYLEIEQMRFQDRLTVKVNVEPLTLDALLPNLILQPLVENAIRHGIAPRAAAGSVEIRAEQVQSRLKIAVRDDGPGLRGANGRKGIGLANTRTRLKQMYGDDHDFKIENNHEGGVTVAIEIPFHTVLRAGAQVEQ